MPEITRKVRIGTILTNSIDEIIFSKLENRIWHDYGHKYKGHEFYQIDDYGTVCEPPLYL